MLWLLLALDIDLPLLSFHSYEDIELPPPPPLYQIVVPVPKLLVVINR